MSHFRPEVLKEHQELDTCSTCIWLGIDKQSHYVCKRNWHNTQTDNTCRDYKFSSKEGVVVDTIK